MMSANNEDDFQPKKSKYKFNCKLKKKMASKYTDSQLNSAESSRSNDDLHSPITYSMKRVTKTSRKYSKISSLDETIDIKTSNDVIVVKLDQEERANETPDMQKLTYSEGLNEGNVMHVASEECLKSPGISNQSMDSCGGQGSEEPFVEPHGENIKIVQEMRNDCVIEQGENSVKTNSFNSSDNIINENGSAEKLSDMLGSHISDIKNDSDNGTDTSCKESVKLLSCPLCWKTFEKNQTQIGHMKMCAARHNMTTRQLLDALKLQEKQAAERRALGLPHIPKAQAAKKSISRKSGGGGTDGNLQLALALSASIQDARENKQFEEDVCLLEAGLGQEVVERQKMMLERYGFTSSRPAVLTASNPRSRASNKKSISSVLKRRTKEERERLVTEKVAIILMEDENKPASDVPCSLQPFSISDKLKKYQITTPSLWEKVTSLEEERLAYYVTDLSNFISPTKVNVGAKLKHLSQVPGRAKTPEKKLDLTPTKKGLDSSPEEKIGPLKETCLKSRESLPRSSIGKLSPEKYSDENGFTETFINDWSHILNKKAMSDLKIYVEKDREIPAHKLVFYARCRTVLQDVVSEINAEANKKSSDMLLWIDTSYQAALAFLQFVYCGLTSKVSRLNEEDVLSVKKLAKRYQVSELVKYFKHKDLARPRVSIHKDMNSSLLSKELNGYSSISRCQEKRSFLSNKKESPSPKMKKYLDESVSETSKAYVQVSNLNEEHHIFSVHKSREQTEREMDKFESSEQCSIRSASPDLFLDDPGQFVDGIMEETSQEASDNRNCLLSLIDKSLLTQNSPPKRLSGKLSKTSPRASFRKTSPKYCTSTASSSSGLSTCVRERNIDHIKTTQSIHHFDDHISVDLNVASEPQEYFSTSPKRQNLPIHQSLKPDIENRNHSFKISEKSPEKLKSSFNRIDFLETLLSDSSPSKMSTKTSLTPKRKHSGSDYSDKSDFSSKKLCRESVTNNDLLSLSAEMDVEEIKKNTCIYDNNTEKLTCNISIKDSTQTETKENSLEYEKECLENDLIAEQYNDIPKRKVSIESADNKSCEAVVADLEGKPHICKEFEKGDMEIFDLTQSSTDSETKHISPSGSLSEEFGQQGLSPPKNISEEPLSEDLIPSESIFEKPGSQNSSFSESIGKQPLSHNLTSQRVCKDLSPSRRICGDIELKDLSYSENVGEEFHIQDSNLSRNIFEKSQSQHFSSNVRKEIVTVELSPQSSPFKKKESHSEVWSSPKLVDVENQPQNLNICRSTNNDSKMNTVDSNDNVAVICNSSVKEVDHNTQNDKCNSVASTVRKKDESKTLNDVQNEDDWDSFDELCNAAIPNIFSQCLTKLLSTKNATPGTKKSGKKRQGLSSLSDGQIQDCTSGKNFLHKTSPERRTSLKSKRELSFGTKSQLTPENKYPLENSLLRQLNETVLWRDENAPELKSCPRKSPQREDYKTPTQDGRYIHSEKVTPPADYSTMKTPQLKKELERYGLKPSLTKKQAKIMLRHIYDQLHPFITVSEFEEESDVSENKLSPFRKPDKNTRVPRSPVKSSKNPVRRNINLKICERSVVKTGSIVKPQSDVESDSDDFPSSQDSSSSSTVGIAEEVFWDDSETLTQSIPSSQDASSSDLAAVVQHFITSDTELHQKVLLYEPIWIENLHADLKANGFKFKISHLMDFLDEQCITFRSVQGHKNRQRKRLKKEAKKKNLLSKKKGKKSSPHKSTSNSAVNSSHSDC